MEKLINIIKIGEFLYFLSDDEIKEGDWCLHNNGEIYQNSFGVLGSVIGRPDYIKENCKKIIATTDESLRIDSTIRESDFMSLDYGKVLSIIPRPSDSFIKKYIEEYNAGKKIETVLVEYEGIEWLDKPLEYFLKVDSDNTITITKLKDSYSREELMGLLQDAFDAGYNRGVWECQGGRQARVEPTFETWIKENL